MKHRTARVKTPRQAITSSLTGHTFVPVYVSETTDAWREWVDERHGDHLQDKDGTCILLAVCDGPVFGDWIVTYRYDDDQGTYDHVVYVAGAVEGGGL